MGDMGHEGGVVCGPVDTDILRPMCLVRNGHVSAGGASATGREGRLFSSDGLIGRTAFNVPAQQWGCLLTIDHRTIHVGEGGRVVRWEVRKVPAGWQRGPGGWRISTNFPLTVHIKLLPYLHDTSHTT